MAKTATKKVAAAKKKTATAKKTVTKSTKKKTATKGTAKKATTKKTVEKPSLSRKTSKLPADEKRQRFLKTLWQFKATSPTKTKTKTEIAAKDGELTEFDCYGLGYHKNALAKEGLVKTADIEGTRQLGYYLTDKGVKAAKVVK